MAFQVRIGKTKANAFSGTGTEGTDYIELPISSTYKTTSTTLVSQGRNSNGVLQVSIVRSGIRKIEMSWRVMSSADYSKLGTFFNNNFSFFAYYFDQDDNGWASAEADVREFYVGDRVADVVQNKQWKSTSVGGLIAPEFVENLKLSFIEL